MSFRLTPPLSYRIDSETPIKWLPINATVLGDNELIPAVPGKKLRVLSMWFTTSIAIGITLKSAGNIKVQPFSTAALTPFSLLAHVCGWLVETNPGEAFVLNQSLVSNTRGGLIYVEV